MGVVAVDAGQDETERDERFIGGAGAHRLEGPVKRLRSRIRRARSEDRFDDASLRRIAAEQICVDRVRRGVYLNSRRIVRSTYPCPRHES